MHHYYADKLQEYSGYWSAHECAPLDRLLGGGGVQDWLRRLGGLQGGALHRAPIVPGLLRKRGCCLLHVLHV